MENLIDWNALPPAEHRALVAEARGAPANARVAVRLGHGCFFLPPADARARLEVLRGSNRRV